MTIKQNQHMWHKIGLERREVSQPNIFLGWYVWAMAEVNIFAGT